MVTRRTIRPAAFTLPELIVSMAILSILTLGLGSAIFLASRALPDPDQTTIKLVQESQIADQIATEIQEAVHITEHTAQAIAFTVADRDADGSPERIRYAWSGTAGDPLTRQYNGGSAVTVLDDVHQFALNYDVASITEVYPGVPVEGSESLLSSYYSTYDLKEYDADRNKWIGQYFTPTLPVDAVDWKVTRIFFAAEPCGKSDGVVAVQLRPANAGNLPTDTVLEQHTMYESQLPDGYTWRLFSFANVCNIDPSAGLCLVLQVLSSSDHAAHIRYHDRNGSGMFTTGNAGASWTYKSTWPMRYYVYGTSRTPGSPQTAARQYVTGIRLSLQSGTDSDARIDTSVWMPNTPELLTAVWELDFNTDPTALDMNGDGNHDWADADGRFAPASLVSGAWHVDSQLEAYPDHDFTKLTTVNARFRTTATGVGALLRINVDWSGDTLAEILVSIELVSATKQQLTVKAGTASGAYAVLTNKAKTSTDFVDLRLVIDPDLDTVSVSVNDTHYGTYRYTIFEPDTKDPLVAISTAGAAAEFDSVSIRVSQ